MARHVEHHAAVGEAWGVEHAATWQVAVFVQQLAQGLDGIEDAVGGGAAQYDLVGADVEPVGFVARGFQGHGTGLKHDLRGRRVIRRQAVQQRAQEGGFVGEFRTMDDCRAGSELASASAEARRDRARRDAADLLFGQQVQGCVVGMALGGVRGRHPVFDVAHALFDAGEGQDARVAECNDAILLRQQVEAERRVGEADDPELGLVGDVEGFVRGPWLVDHGGEAEQVAVHVVDGEAGADGIGDHLAAGVEEQLPAGGDRFAGDVAQVQARFEDAVAGEVAQAFPFDGNGRRAWMCDRHCVP